MSTWLIASVGIVYFVIGAEMAWTGRYALMLVWWGGTSAVYLCKPLR